MKKTMKHIHLVMERDNDTATSRIQTAWFNKNLAKQQRDVSNDEGAEHGLSYDVVSIPIQDSVGDLHEFISTYKN